MMKKLLVLALVLGVVSMATAGLKISVDGNKAYDGSLVVTPGSTVSLGIFTDAALVPTGDYVLPFYALVVHGSQGTIVADPVANKVLVGYDAVFIDNGAVANGGMPVPEGMEGAFGGITIWSTDAALALNQSIFDGIQLTVLNTAVVQLWTIDDSWGLGGMLDQAVITTPEPMTMVLLGLGGLLIRRKK
jgi:hypothetical protein